MSRRIYIVEDDIALAEELKRLLELNGYEVETCSDFPNAAGLALAFSPDCNLLDLKLPDADGQEICCSIRKESDVPIIVLTSMSDAFIDDNTLNVNRLRKALSGIGVPDDFLQTRRSQGYVIEG